MDPKRISELTTPNAVREASDDTLDDLYNRAVGYLSHSDPNTVRYMQASIDSIRIEQTHRRLKKDSDNKPVDTWKNKVVVSIVTGIILLIIGATLKRYFPTWFK